MSWGDGGSPRGDEIVDEMEVKPITDAASQYLDHFFNSWLIHLNPFFFLKMTKLFILIWCSEGEIGDQQENFI